MSSNRSSSGTPLQPTFYGYIGTTMDALILFEACLTGQLTHIPRRPQDRERHLLIRSGNIFIYEEHSSGIKRWTDGVPWSPSRILNNFLLYRELEKPFQPGEKKRAMRRPPRNDGVSKTVSKQPTMTTAGQYTGAMITAGGGLIPTGAMSPGMLGAANPNDADRPYIGSLIDSYKFKENGLIKKTISVQHQGVTHHLVSYYNLEDIKSGQLKRVKASPQMAHIAPRQSLLATSNFRSPVDDDNEMDVVDSNLNLFYMQSFDITQSQSAPRPQLMPQDQYRPSSYSAPAFYGQTSGFIGLTSSVPQHNQQYYHVDPSFGASPQSNYNQVVPANRGQSYVVNTNGANHGYPNTSTPLLVNGGGMAAISSPYMNGDMFNHQASEHATESPEGTSTQEYSSTTQRGGQLPNGTDPAVGRGLNEQEFATTFHDHQQHQQPAQPSSAGHQQFVPSSSSNSSSPAFVNISQPEMPSPVPDWALLPQNYTKREPSSNNNWS